MAVTLQTLLPAPLTGKTFMEASHFQLAQDRRPEADVGRSSFKRDFPAWCGVSRPDPFSAHTVKNIIHEDRRKIRELTSETNGAFPQKSLKYKAASPTYGLQKTNYKAHSDPKTLTFQTSFSADYIWPGATEHSSTAGLAAMMEKSSVPSGDPDKIRLPPSIYKSSYQGHDVKLYPYIKVPCAYLDGETIKGDRRGDSQSQSIYKTDFKGERSDRPPLIVMSGSSIVYGDCNRICEQTTEQGSAYSAYPPRDCRGFNKDEAITENCQSHLKLGDGLHRFCTTSKVYQIPDLGQQRAAAGLAHREPRELAVPGHEHQGRTPEWDGVSISHLVHTQLGLQECQPHADQSQEKTKSCVHFGDANLNSCFFTTTHKADYQHTGAEPKPAVISRSITESSVPLNLHSQACETDVSEMHRSYTPWKKKKEKIEDSTRFQNYLTHIIEPWKDQHFLDTTHQEMYKHIYCGPPERHKSDFQSSHVPLGTLGKKHPQVKMDRCPAQTAEVSGSAERGDIQI